MATSPQQTYIPSPCISVCELDQETNLCKGCQRTPQELGQWRAGDDELRLQIWQNIATRRKAQGLPEHPRTNLLKT